MKPKDYRTMLSGLRRANRKPVQPYGNFTEQPAAKKQMRVLELVAMLCDKPLTLQEMADEMDTSKRTIYRYCAMIVDLGCALEPDEQGKYHLDQCPFCKNNFGK